MKIAPRYVAIAFLLFSIEVGIALFVKDTFIRPFVGDTLAVMLVYCLLRSVGIAPYYKAAGYALVIAYAIEWLQAIDFLNKTGLAHHKWLRIVLGSSFDWGDMLAYTVGFGVVLIIERLRLRRS